MPRDLQIGMWFGPADEPFMCANRNCTGMIRVGDACLKLSVLRSYEPKQEKEVRCMRCWPADLWNLIEEEQHRWKVQFDKSEVGR